jgi:ribosome-associated protein
MSKPLYSQPKAKLSLVSSKTQNQQDSIHVSSGELAQAIAEAADERKGADIVLLNVADVSYLTDYFVIATGFSNTQVKAIARSIADAIEERWHRQPHNAGGKQEGGWVLLDYGDVIAHVFMPEEREFYNLEAFWGHAERIPFVPAPPPGNSSPESSPLSVHPAQDSVQ